MGNILEKNTLSQVFVKGNDYGTEEWAKQLLQNVTSKKLDNVNAFAGVLRFPSDDFLDHNYQQHQTTQFQNSIYVGKMDMLLPKADSSQPQTSFSKLKFNLSGIIRTFIQVSGGNQLDSNSLKFKDYIMAQYPGANTDFVFAREAFQYLTDIQISGSNYQLVNGLFQPVESSSFIPTIEFEFFVSGYKCLLL